jgi:hypothetical protein
LSHLSRLEAGTSHLSSMRVAVSIVCLAASACAWAPSPARLQPARVAALRMSDAAPESEPSAGSLEMLKFWEEWSEPRNKKEEYTRPVLIARFESLARMTGSEDMANLWVRRFPLLMCMEEDRIQLAFDTWCTRVGDTGEAVELLTKNPSLLACKATGEQGIEAAPVGLTKFIAGIIDFTRSE